MMDRLVTLLPLPLSPTMPSTSPWFTSKLVPAHRLYLAYVGEKGGL